MNNLILNGVTISLQNFGTRILVWLEGKQEDIELRHNAFFNHGVTNCELEWTGDTCAGFWLWDNKQKTAMEQFQHAMTQSALFELLQAGGTKGTNPMPQAREIAAARIAEAQWVTWYKCTARLDLHSLGSGPKAERETGDMSDVYESVLQRPGATGSIEQIEEEESA
jgi:hypothetical protein